MEEEFFILENILNKFLKSKRKLVLRKFNKLINSDNIYTLINIFHILNIFNFNI